MTDTVEIIDPSEVTTVDDPTVTEVEITDVETGVVEVVEPESAVEVTEVELETVEVQPDMLVEVGISDVGEPGPPGPAGGPGPPGPAGPPGTTTVVGNLAFVWMQNDPSNTWLIPHNLGFFPAVTVVDSGGNTVEGSVRYVDENNVEVTFASAFGGNAYLS